MEGYAVMLDDRILSDSKTGRLQIYKYLEYAEEARKEYMRWNSIANKGQCPYRIEKINLEVFTCVQ